METIDNIIIERLGEHQRKLEFIRQNIEKEKNPHHSFNKGSYLIISIAACIAIIIAVSPFFITNEKLYSISVPPPSFTEFRSGNPDKLQSLLNEGKYSQALTIVDSALSEIDFDTQHINTKNPTAEEIYIVNLYNDSKEELEWCKIYILLKLGRKDELDECCQNYLSNKEFTLHMEDTKRILKKIH